MSEDPKITDARISSSLKLAGMRHHAFGEYEEAANCFEASAVIEERDGPTRESRGLRKAARAYRKKAKKAEVPK